MSWKHPKGIEKWRQPMLDVRTDFFNTLAVNHWINASEVKEKKQNQNADNEKPKSALFFVKIKLKC